MNTTLTDSQQREIVRLKMYYPFRVVYGAISPRGEFRTGADATTRKMNTLARNGWTVWRA